MSHGIAAALVGMLAAPCLASPVRADPVRDAQWHLTYLNVAEAHRHSQGAGITVAVIDTGVDAAHPDLANSILPGADFTADGGDGRTDVGGHGTGMAGLIAAHGRALGIAPRAKIQSIRISPYALAPGSAVRGIEFAIDHGASVLCLAHGESAAPDLRRAIDRAIAANIVVVAAVGNRPLASTMQYPAGYPGVIAAAGVDRNGNHPGFSITGQQVVLAAPAVDIVSTGLRGGSNTGYRSGTGTSDATAIIAGAAALVRSKYPNLSAAEVVHRLTATADDKGPRGRDDEYGYGVVNIVKALTADVPPLQPTRPPLTATPTTATATAGESTGGSGWLFVAGGAILLLLVVAGAVLWLRYS